MAGVLGPREAAIAKELTKLHESVTRGRLDRLAGEFSDGEVIERRVRGGGGAAGRTTPAEPSDEMILEQLEKALKLDSFRDAVRSVAEVLNVGRARVYELGLEAQARLSMRERRVKAYRRGLFAETVTALLLRLKGYAIVARRYKTPVGEIDLVALKGKRLAFIEVKRRKTKEDAAWTLPAKQRRRIIRAAQYWLSAHPDYAGHDIAFDVVLAAPWAWPRYIENAFSVQ